MSRRIGKCLLGLVMAALLAGAYVPANAQVVVKIGNHHHHRRHYRHHYRHYR